MKPEAFYSDEHRCWFVPVSAQIVEDDDLELGVGPVSIQIKDKQIWITKLELREQAYSVEEQAT